MLTPEQLKSVNKKLTPANTTNSIQSKNAAVLGGWLNSANQAQALKEYKNTPQGKNFLQKIADTTMIPKALASGIAATKGVIGLGKAGIQTLAGNKEGAAQTLRATEADINKPMDSIFGEERAVGAGEEFGSGKTIKDMFATGIGAGTTIGSIGAGSIAGTTGKAIAGRIGEGAVVGGLSSFSQGLERGDKAGQIAKDTAIGAATGAAVSSVFEGIGAALRHFKAAKDLGKNTYNKELQPSKKELTKDLEHHWKTFGEEVRDQVDDAGNPVYQGGYKEMQGQAENVLKNAGGQLDDKLAQLDAAGPVTQELDPKYFNHFIDDAAQQADRAVSGSALKKTELGNQIREIAKRKITTPAEFTAAIEDVFQNNPEVAKITNVKTLTNLQKAIDNNANFMQKQLSSPEYIEVLKGNGLLHEVKGITITPKELSRGIVEELENQRGQLSPAELSKIEFEINRMGDKPLNLQDLQRFKRLYDSLIPKSFWDNMADPNIAVPTQTKYALRDSIRNAIEKLANDPEVASLNQQMGIAMDVRHLSAAQQAIRASQKVSSNSGNPISKLFSRLWDDVIFNPKNTTKASQFIKRAGEKVGQTPLRQAGRTGIIKGIEVLRGLGQKEKE